MMTEQTWKTITGLTKQLTIVKSKRKMRLFCIACCYGIWAKITDERLRDAVRTVESYADGLVSGRDVDNAINTALEAVRDYRASISNMILLYSNERSANYNRYTIAVAIVSMLWAAYRPGCKSVVWSANRLLENAKGTRSARWHSDVMRDLANPFFDGVLPTNSTVLGLAKTIYDDRDYSLMPVLGDALEDAGCTDMSPLEHCRSGKPHYRGCWVVDKILGK